MKFDKKIFYLDYSKIEMWERKRKIKNIMFPVFWIVYLVLLVLFVMKIIEVAVV
jgi:hypothetical protein